MRNVFFFFAPRLVCPRGLTHPSPLDYNDSLKPSKPRRRELKWDIVKDKDATIVWLDKWEMADLTNLRSFKV